MNDYPLPPEEFLDFYQKTGFELPPIPWSLAGELRPAGPSLFSSDPSWLPASAPALSFGVFGPAPAEAGQQAPADAFLRPASFLLCGLMGHGVQSWRHRVVLWLSNCGLALESRCPGAYSDWEEPLSEINADYDLIRMCLAAVQPGWVYAGHQDAGLYLVKDAYSFTFRITGEKGTLLLESDEPSLLLDILAAGPSASGADMNRAEWMTV